MRDASPARIKGAMIMLKKLFANHKKPKKNDASKATQPVATPVDYQSIAYTQCTMGDVMR